MKATNIVHGDRGEDIRADSLDKIRVDFYAAMARAKTARDVADIKVVFLGKKGRLTYMLRGLGAMSADDRMRVSREINGLKAEIEAGIDKQ